MFNPAKIKKDFPIFKDKNLVFLDNASTSQKPKIAIEALKKYYENFNANINRGIYEISQKSTDAYEKTRQLVAEFINAKSSEEIIFTRNTTESINLVAYSWGNQNIKSGDEIIVSILEHHSNLVPWQELCKRKKAKLKFIPLKKDFTLDLEIYKSLFTKKTKLVAITGMSNALGTILDLKKIIEIAHKNNALVLVDGAQSVAHIPTNVQKLDCDFLAFSAHKMLGPTGVGILYAKKQILEKMPPFITGGGMIKEVNLQKSTYANIPQRFEAGTPNIADVIAFAEAIKYLKKIGMENIMQHEKILTEKCKKMLAKYPEVTVYSPKNPKETGGTISFTIKGIHPHDISQIFSEEGIAIRAGHHCCHPLMKTLKVPATARISFYLYNTEEDIEKLEKALKKTIKKFF